jgi:hypothetical protein
MRKYGDPPRPKGPRPAVPPPMRGKRGQERRLGERITAEALDRLLAEREVSPEVDFDIGDGEAEAAEAIEAEARGAGAPLAARATAARPTRPADKPSEPGRGARRVPDLSALPALLAQSGSSPRCGNASAIRRVPSRPPDATPA